MKKNTVYCVLVLVSLFNLFMSCKQSNGSGTEENKILNISVKADSHVKKLPSDFKLKRGTVLSFSELNEEMADMEFEIGYEIHKMFVGKVGGIEITNTDKYTFNADTAIFVTSKSFDIKDELKLIFLKVDGIQREIKNIIDGGKTKKQEVLVEVKASPADAIVESEPPLQNGNWKLSKGMNKLILKIKKGNDEKAYTINLEKLDEDIPTLKKITIGDGTKEKNEITSLMNFTVPRDATEVKVEAETEPMGATLNFTPTLEANKLSLTGDETLLKIEVGSSEKKTEYQVKVKKALSPKTLIDTLYVFGGRNEGKFLDIDDATITRILNGEKDIVLEIAGPVANLVLASKTKELTLLEVNGKRYEVRQNDKNKSIGTASLVLPQKEETIDVSVKVKDEEDVVEFSFKIKRTSQTVDVPVDKLYIRDNNVIDTGEVLPALFAGTKVFMGSETTYLEVRSNLNAIKQVIIDGKSCEVENKKDENDVDVWFSGSFVSGVPAFPTPPNPTKFKEVTISIEPIDEETYHSVSWTFKLIQDRKKSLDVDFEINGKTSYELDYQFFDDLEKDKNPSISVEGEFLNLKLILGSVTAYSKIQSVKINNEVRDENSFYRKGTQTLLNHSVPLTTEEKQIEIIITPSDSSGYPEKTLKFKAKGSGAAEKINPVFEEISGDKNFPKVSFLDKLTDGSKPLRKVSKKEADILISLNAYEYDFLCKEVLINGKKTKINVIFEPTGLLYKIKKSISVNDVSPIDVKIEFIGKTAKNLTWEFQVQGGGDKPSLPQKIAKLRINGRTSYGGYNPLPQDFLEHLTDGSNPEFEFDGKSVFVEAGSIEEDEIKKVIFKMDGEQKEEVIPTQSGTQYFAGYTFKVPDLGSHLVELIIYPKKEAYSPLSYSFNVKSTGKKLIMPVSFSIDNFDTKTGTKEKVEKEDVIIAATCRQDLMKEVKIGEKDSSGNVINEKIISINKVYTYGSNFYYEASLEVALSPNVEKHFVIKVIPKEVEDYEEVSCDYYLQGTAIPNNNAEFVYGSGQNPGPVYETIEWLEGVMGKDATDYGAKTVILKARTLSPRAKVKYQIVNPVEDKDIASYTVQEMQNTLGHHESPIITLFDDKPTKIKVWVVAEDGNTTNEQRGRWGRIYNYVPLTYGYKDTTSGQEYTNKAYDLIELDKASIQSDKKVYLVFAPWKEEKGYTVVKEGLPAYQTAFVKLGLHQNEQELYKTSIDVSSLLGSTPSTLEAILNIKKGEKECLTYKVKIKLKE